MMRTSLSCMTALNRDLPLSSSYTCCNCSSPAKTALGLPCQGKVLAVFSLSRELLLFFFNPASGNQPSCFPSRLLATGNKVPRQSGYSTA